MKRIFLSVLFICTFLSHLTAQTGKESELIKQNYIRSVIGQDESKQAFLQLLSKIPPEKEVSDQNVIELQQLYPIRREEIHRLISTIRGRRFMAGHQLCRYQTLGMGTETTHRADTETNQILCPRKRECFRTGDFSRNQHYSPSHELLVHRKTGLQKLVVQSNRYSPHLGTGFPPFRSRNDGKRKAGSRAGDGTIPFWHDRTEQSMAGRQCTDPGLALE